MEDSRELPQNRKQLSHDPARRPSQATQPRHRWVFIQRKQTLMRTPVFTTASSLTVETGKQPKCPSTDEWMKMSLCLSLSHTNMTRP